MRESWGKAEVGGSQMPCFVTSSEGDASRPGVVVCMHAPGVDGFIQRTARKLCEARKLRQRPRSGLPRDAGREDSTEKRPALPPLRCQHRPVSTPHIES
jgi:hypothetical protein